MTNSRPPLPPFTADTAAQKARLAEDAWNRQDPKSVALAYTPDRVWRNRSTFLQGREAIVAFLTAEWEHEHDYRLIKEVWAFHGNRIAARFADEFRTAGADWFRTHGNEQWQFDVDCLIERRETSINDVAIATTNHLFTWGPGPRPDDFPGMTDLGL